MTTLVEFIKFLESQPESTWCVNSFTDSEGRHCALGHCRGVGTSVELVYLAPEINQVNDNQRAFYNQPTPKARVLAYLNDLNNNEVSILEH